MRLFLDANVLFTAAHNPGGRSAALFALARSGACMLVTSPHALEEARRNLRLKHPRAGDVLESLLAVASVVPEVSSKDLAWALDQGLPLKDAPILAAAAQARADVLVTGDRAHFGPLFGKRLRGVEVLPPVDALARLLR
jgi:predicted nucleic acid-binding protein